MTTSADPVWTTITSLAASRHGVVGTAELARRGVGASRIRRFVRSGRLVKVAPRTWRVAGAPATWEQRLAIGLTCLGPEALVSHEAAARLHQFDRSTLDEVHFLVPRDLRGVAFPPDASVHTSSFIDRLDRVAVGEWPVTSATRTVLDLASIGVGRARLEAAIDSAIRRRLSSPLTIERRLEGLRGTGRRGSQLIAELVVDSGGESILERRFLALVRRAGVPRPTTQYSIRSERRLVARVDFAWVECSVVVEVSGQHGHSSPSERTADAQRRDELQDLGWSVYEYTWQHVTSEARYVVSSLTERLRRAGWVGPG